MKKGFTLVEVLIAMVVFSLMLMVSISSLVFASTLASRQNEYLYFESICLDIDKYSTKYGRDWNEYYFDNLNTTQYYNQSYQLVDEESVYQLSFLYNQDNQLIINVKTTKGNRYIIKNLNYGSDRYE